MFLTKVQKKKHFDLKDKSFNYFKRKCNKMGNSKKTILTLEETNK